MGHPVIPLISQRRENTHAVQFISNMGSTESFQTLSENIPYHTRCILVNFQTLMLVASFYITVNSKSSNKITAASFHIQGTPGLYGNIPAVCLVHNVFYRYGEIICSVIFRVYIVIDGDKTDAVGRKYPTHITARLYVLTPQAGKVFYNDTVSLALFDHPHHFLKCWTVKEDTAVTVVNLFCHNLNLRVPGNEIINEPPLIGNAVTFHRLVIRIGKTDVLNGLVNLHKKTLLSLRRKIPAIQEVWLCRIQFLFRLLLYHALTGKSALFWKKFCFTVKYP